MIQLEARRCDRHQRAGDKRPHRDHEHERQDRQTRPGYRNGGSYEVDDAFYDEKTPSLVSLRQRIADVIANIPSNRA